jgi:transposase
MIPKKKLSFKAIAVAAAIDMNGKVVAIHLQQKSIDSDAYVVFLKKVARQTKRRKCVMLVDNLGVHRTHNVREQARKSNIELLFNGTYSSEYNPIERLWAWSKQRFQKQCVDDGPYHLQHRMERLVEEIVTSDY